MINNVDGEENIDTEENDDTKEADIKEIKRTQIITSKFLK